MSQCIVMTQHPQTQLSFSGCLCWTSSGRYFRTSSNEPDYIWVLLQVQIIVSSVYSDGRWLGYGSSLTEIHVFLNLANHASILEWLRFFSKCRFKQFVGFHGCFKISRRSWCTNIVLSSILQRNHKQWSVSVVYSPNKCACAHKSALWFEKQFLLFIVIT
jgi:hypothetical protein